MVYYISFVHTKTSRRLMIMPNVFTLKWRDFDRMDTWIRNINAAAGFQRFILLHILTREISHVRKGCVDENAQNPEKACSTNPGACFQEKHKTPAAELEATANLKNRGHHATQQQEISRVGN